mmetsp:Transcript_23147/g.60493  ORF Transcript_23147/g.60493 Transcript_23147/m.60493 type:complete len:227 (-) Transcript_23147:392-1072(-)
MCQNGVAARRSMASELGSSRRVAIACGGSTLKVVASGSLQRPRIAVSERWALPQGLSPLVGPLGGRPLNQGRGGLTANDERWPLRTATRRSGGLEAQVDAPANKVEPLHVLSAVWQHSPKEHHVAPPHRGIDNVESPAGGRLVWCGGAEVALDKSWLQMAAADKLHAPRLLRDVDQRKPRRDHVDCIRLGDRHCLVAMPQVELIPVAGAHMGPDVLDWGQRDFGAD